MRRWGAPILWLVLAAATPVQAQQPADPIGSLLDRRQPPPKDSDEPDTAGQPPSTLEPEPVIIAPASGLPPVPIPYAPPPRPQVTTPIRVDEVGKTPDAPPTLKDVAYDSRIRSSFASAQAFQGPLDGGWTLAADGEGDLYNLQLSNRGDRLEGAWRDLHRKGALDASGLVDDIQRSGSQLTLRFSPAAGRPGGLATPQGGYDGRWTGELAQGSERKRITLRRTAP